MYLLWSPYEKELTLRENITVTLELYDCRGGCVLHDKGTVYTIGYSGFPDMEAFLRCLKDADIRLLVDVRSTPYSQYYQQYDKPFISEMLKNNGIQYRNYSREFGARQEDKSFYRNGRLDFSVFVQSSQFLEGVKKVHSAIKLGYTPVLMCAEKEPATCHRAIMISRFFYNTGFDIRHFMPEGHSKTQRDVENELLDAYFKSRNQLSLFEAYKQDEELIPEAYVKRNDEIGFREEEL